MKISLIAVSTLTCLLSVAVVVGRQQKYYYGNVHVVPRSSSSSSNSRRMQGDSSNTLDGAGIARCRVDEGTLCGLCQGDCNTDDDCEGDLVCFQKEADVWNVPGCIGVSRSTTDWCVSPEMVSGPIKGYVFDDTNKNSVQDDGEAGIEGIMVSDGTNVVLTDSDGYYELPAPSSDYEAAGFSVFVTKPDGYEVPLNERNIPQFYYVHKPMGTPMNLRGEPFRYGGLAPTGPMPEQINFPMMQTESKTTFKMIVSGDPQTYSNTEVGYTRDTIVKEISEMDDLEGVIFEVDVMGDELSLYQRFEDVVAVADIPQYFAAGNHDYDFDSPHMDHSFDTFPREFGPEYYSFEIGQVHFVVLEDVRYPCLAEEDNLDGLHEFCDYPTRSDYNGVVPERQLEWLKNDLAQVPTDKLVFLHLHIPIHSFIDQNLIKHMVDNTVDLYEAVGCSRGADGSFSAENCERRIVSASAHTHTVENMLPGEVFEGFLTTLDQDSLLDESRVPGATPFHQLILGAASGSWWSGDFDSNGIPESYQRLGAPKGYFIFEFDGNTYKETYKAAGKPLTEQMHMDILTPAFREWYEILANWTSTSPGSNDIPPVNINDLPDTKIVVESEKSESILSVNVWNGNRNTTVTASFNRGPELTMTRTQEGNGENILESLDVYAMKRQMMVARFAYVTNSTEPRSNGYELFRYSIRCPDENGERATEPTACTPRPLGSSRWADQSTHVWQIPIPEDLDIGSHTLRVTVTDHYGRTFYSSMAFEILEERPPKYFKKELWEQFP